MACLVGADEATQSEKPAVKADRPDGLTRDVTAITVGDCLLGYKAVQRRMPASRWNPFPRPDARDREIDPASAWRHRAQGR